MSADDYTQGRYEAAAQCVDDILATYTELVNGSNTDAIRLSELFESGYQGTEWATTGPCDLAAVAIQLLAKAREA